MRTSPPKPDRDRSQSPILESLRLGILVAAAALLIPVALRAQDEAQLSAYKDWTIVSLNVTGIEPKLASELRNGLALRPRFDPLRRQRPRFFPRLLAEDLARSRLFMARRGYPHASVEARFSPVPDKRELELTLQVRPGGEVRVASLTVESPPLWNDGRLRSRLPLRDGGIFTDAAATTGRLALLDALADAGHARAEVDLEIQPLDSTRIAVRYLLSPGPSYRFVEIAVDGATPDLLPLVRRSIGIAPGTRYSPGALHGARDRLRLLDLFRQVRLEARPAAGDTLDLHVDLLPRKLRELEGGLGYWTDEYFRGKIRWRHRNLFRAGRGLELRVAASRFLVDAGAQLSWPSLLGTATRSTLGASLRREWEPNYDLHGVEFRAATSYRPSLLQDWKAALTVADYRIESKASAASATDELIGLLSTAMLAWQRNGTDDRLLPRHGTRVRLRGEIGLPGALSGSHFAAIDGEASVYANPFDGLVVAGRLGLGVATPLEDSSDILPNKRFYAGGESSMRGFGRRRLGPRNAEGIPRGGRCLFLGSGELRFPIVRKLRGAVFADVGQVWRRPGDAAFADLELAIGPGILVQTPVGPIRADWGFRLTDVVRDEPNSVLQLSIGQPF